MHIVNDENYTSLLVFRLHEISSFAGVHYFNCFLYPFYCHKSAHWYLHKLEFWVAVNFFQERVDSKAFAWPAGSHDPKMLIIKNIVLISISDIKQYVHQEEALRDLNRRYQ